MGLSNVIGGAVARGLLVVAVMTFTLNLLALILPIYMLQVYDRVLSSASLPTLVYPHADRAGRARDPGRRENASGAFCSGRNLQVRVHGFTGA